MRRMALWLIPLVLAGTLAGGDEGEGAAPERPAQAAAEPRAPEARRKQTRAEMREIYAALAAAYPLSLDEQAFVDPANRERIRAALARLATHAERLDTHGRELNPSFEFLRRSLVEDARQARERFDEGNPEWARFTLQQLTENCFACHSKLPSERDFPLGKRFLEDTRGVELAPETRARLQVATRQFDAALASYESMFASPEFGVDDLYWMGAFEDYLKVVIRVRRDFDRAIASLGRAAARPDAPPYLREILEGWINALGRLRDRPETDGLARARELVHEARLEKRFPADRRGLVQFVVASSLLQRYIDSAVRDREKLAEAYYWLGVTESHISQTAWLSETEFFLETSIRLSPRGPLARDAYAFLEEYTLWGYTGSAGVQLPPEVAAHLAELRRLIDAGPVPPRMKETP